MKHSAVHNLTITRMAKPQPSTKEAGSTRVRLIMVAVLGNQDPYSRKLQLEVDRVT